MRQALIQLDISTLQHEQSLLALSGLIKKSLHKASKALNELFWQNANIHSLLYTRASWHDEILSFAWDHFSLNEAALIAVGGYAFARLHPHSDTDILILIKDHSLDEQIEQFIAFCWDCGIALGASVRTFEECLGQAQQDLSIYSTLLNTRFLCGSVFLFQQFTSNFAQIDALWSFKQFFSAKYAQRQARYASFQNTEYNLEPNIKESPGGLRDLDLIFWLCAKKYQANNLIMLVQHHDISQNDYETLKEAQLQLWRIRYAVHLLSPSSNEKLYFEYQAELTKRFIIQAPSLNQAISALMQPYYQTASKLRKITDLLCLHFQESLDGLPEHPKTPLTYFCEKSQDFLHITTPELDATALMELFYLIAKYDLKGFTSGSIKIIQSSLGMTTSFFNNHNTHHFLALLQLPQHVAKTLNLMHQLSVLTRYIPEFSAITGQMQYDLVHLYTVDAHTLMLVHYLELFSQASSFDKFEQLKNCKQLQPDFSLLYIAALYHDIGKGSGLDHSLVGREKVNAFCLRTQLSPEITQLITWLVENHLLMSSVSQKKDISDEKVITEFVATVKTQERLNYLTLFTVADMLAANPTLWNHWRATLLQELYQAASYSLQNVESITSINKAQRNKHDAIEILQQFNEINDGELIADLWKNFNDEYFTGETSANIAWQARMILQDIHHQKVITTAIRPHHNQHGVTLFIYAPDKSNLFAAICACLEKNRLTIVQARVFHTANHYSLQSFVALEVIENALMDEQRLGQIQGAVDTLLAPIADGNNCQVPKVSRHIPLHQRFGFKRVTLTTSPEGDKTLLEVQAPDFPGLLARIGEVFINNHIRVHSALINTLGGQVEDIFYITDKGTLKALTDEQQIANVKSGIEEAIGKYCK